VVTNGRDRFAASVHILRRAASNGISAQRGLGTRPRQEARNRLHHRFSVHLPTSIYIRSRRGNNTDQLPTTQIFLRTPEPETARWASDCIGSHEVERLAISQVTGLSNYREGLTLNPHRSVEPLVIPGELQGLEPFEGYICCGGARTTISVPKMHLVKHNPDFIPRLNAPVEPTPETEGPDDEEILDQLKARAAVSMQEE
jgi:hypothetical protein